MSCSKGFTLNKEICRNALCQHGIVNGSSHLFVKAPFFTWISTIIILSTENPPGGAIP
jgi:hypothetical protein